MHETLQVTAGIIGIFAYLMLIKGIWKEEIKQSFAAFLLWGLLDLIATITTITALGNFWLPLSNALGSCVIALMLAMKQRIQWSVIETVSALLVIICLVVWYVSGETYAIVASSIAVVIASIPQMAETWKRPQDTPVLPYVVFLIANIVSFAGGRDWSIAERFYAGCAIFLCLVILTFALRRSKRRQELKHPH